jgi:hypothetical protein
MASALTTAPSYDDRTQWERPAPSQIAIKPATFEDIIPAQEVDERDAIGKKVRTPPRLLPELPEPQRKETKALIPLQSWEGVVLEVYESSFLARLVDIQADHPDEEIEIAQDELSPFDLALLESGAIFYWTIGYRQQLPAGARERVSLIRFRRLPAWSDAELIAAREHAETLAEDLGW